MAGYSLELLPIFITQKILMAMVWPTKIESSFQVLVVTSQEKLT